LPNISSEKYEELPKHTTFHFASVISYKTIWRILESQDLMILESQDLRILESQDLRILEF